MPYHNTNRGLVHNQKKADSEPRSQSNSQLTEKERNIQQNLAQEGEPSLGTGWEFGEGDRVKTHRGREAEINNN